MCWVLIIQKESWKKASTLSDNCESERMERTTTGENPKNMLNLNVKLMKVIICSFLINYMFIFPQPSFWRDSAVNRCHCHHGFQHQSTGHFLQKKGEIRKKTLRIAQVMTQTHKPSFYVHTLSWRNVSNASRKDEGQWEYKEVHLFTGEDKQGNKTIMSRAKNLLMAHIYIHARFERQKWAGPADKAITSFHLWFCPEASPFSPLHCPAHACQVRVINV